MDELTKLKRVIEEKDELISGLRVHLREICLDRYPVVVERDELRHQLEDMIKVQEKLLAEKEFYKHKFEELQKKVERPAVNGSPNSASRSLRIVVPMPPAQQDSLDLDSSILDLSESDAPSEEPPNDSDEGSSPSHPVSTSVDPVIATTTAPPPSPVEDHARLMSRAPLTVPSRRPVDTDRVKIKKSKSLSELEGRRSRSSEVFSDQGSGWSLSKTWWILLTYILTGEKNESYNRESPRERKQEILTV